MDACKLDADANQKLKKWLISPEVGYDLGELPDEGFLLLSYDDLQKAGLPWEEWQSCQVRMALQVLAGEPAASNGTPLQSRSSSTFVILNMEGVRQGRLASTRQLHCTYPRQACSSKSKVAWQSLWPCSSLKPCTLHMSPAVDRPCPL